MPILSEFKPSWWLKNRHLQSCYSTFHHIYKKLNFTMQRLELPDGDFIDVALLGPHDAPCVVILPGLEGSIYSGNIQVLSEAITAMGWQVAVMQYRSCSGYINRMAKSYNSLDDSDFSYFIKTLLAKQHLTPLYAVGISLGGNILLHYLKNTQSPFQASVTVSTPFDMKKSVDSMSLLYHKYLIRSMKKKTLQKIKQGILMPASFDQIKKIKNLREYDELLTAPLYDYSNADHYYDTASCHSFLININEPTLMLYAEDDPFIPRNSIPTKDRISPSIELTTTQNGGHVGFISGHVPGRIYKSCDKMAASSKL